MNIAIVFAGLIACFLLVVAILNFGSALTEKKDALMTLWAIAITVWVVVIAFCAAILASQLIYLN